MINILEESSVENSLRLAGWLERQTNASLVSSRLPLLPFTLLPPPLGPHSPGATVPLRGPPTTLHASLERPTGRRGEASGLSPGADDHYRTQLYLPLYLPDLLETAIMRRLNSARCCAQIRHQVASTGRGCASHPAQHFRPFRETVVSPNLRNLRRVVGGRTISYRAGEKYIVYLTSGEIVWYDWNVRLSEI